MSFSPRIFLHPQLLSLLAVTSLACGGMAIIDPGSDSSSGGAGGSTTSSSTQASSTTNTASMTNSSAVTSTSTSMITAVTSTSSGNSSTCIQGCDKLFACSQVDNLCPAFKGANAMTEKEFKDDCVANPLCSGAGSIVLNAEDCENVIMAIKGLSADFKALCEGTDNSP
jgi:hypothetical protein